MCRRKTNRNYDNFKIDKEFVLCFVKLIWYNPYYRLGSLVRIGS